MAQKILGLETLDPKKFESQKIMRSKNFGSRKIWFEKKVLVLENYLVQKYLGSKNILGQKNVGSKQILGLKKLICSKKFRKKILAQKFLKAGGGGKALGYSSLIYMKPTYQILDSSYA